MAEKEHIEKEAVTKKETLVRHDPKDAPSSSVAAHPSRQWVLGVVAIVVVVYLLLMVGGLWILRSVDNNRNDRMDGFSWMTAGRHMDRSGFDMMGDRTYTISQSNSDGLTTTATKATYTQTQGVVTVVSDDSLVVAGGGKTQTIKTNAATVYVDDVKAAVNDSVAVVGTKDGDTITATQITVYN